MNKKLLIIIVIAVFFVVALFSVSPPQKKGEGKFVLILDYGNNHRQSFRLIANEQRRAWSLLQEVVAVSEIDLEATNDFFPGKINGMKDGTDNKHWVFYVNGIKQNLSPIEAVVAPPAEVVFRFE